MAPNASKIKEKMKKVLASAMTEYQVSLAEGYHFPTICVASMPNGNTEYFAIDDLDDESVEEAIKLAGAIGAINVSIVGVGTIMDTETLEQEEGICLMFIQAGRRNTMFQLFDEDGEFERISGKIIDLGEDKISNDNFLQKQGFEP